MNIQMTIGRWTVVALCAGCVPQSGEGTTPKPAAAADAREVHLADVRRVTLDGLSRLPEFSSSGAELLFVSRGDTQCMHVYRVSLDAPGEPVRVSPEAGSAISASFFPGDRRVVFESDHLAPRDCASDSGLSSGSDIFSARPDGTELRRLTDSAGYDGMPTVCSRNGSIVFTSSRDGDLELYRMDADGANLKRLTHEVGFDGHARFSSDCKQVTWTASRPRGKKAVDEYKKLSAKGEFPALGSEIMVVNDDGKEMRQITYLGVHSWSSVFYPSGRRVLFTSDRGNDENVHSLWAVNTDGTGLERITYSDAHSTASPAFSSDGSQLAFVSTRAGPSAPIELDVFVAKWVESQSPAARQPADRLLADIAWLADDARGGRGVGSDGLQAAADWIVDRFRKVGLEGGLEGGKFLQSFDVTTSVVPRATTMLMLDGKKVDGKAFSPVGHSAQGDVKAPIVFVGFGITAKDIGHDDYAKKNVKGKIVLVRRFTPETGRFGSRNLQRRYSDLHYKAWNAREHGAKAIIVADLPLPGKKAPDEAPMPRLNVEAIGMSAIPVVVVKRALAQKLTRGRHRAHVRVDLDHTKAPTHNVVAKLTAGAKNKLPGVVVVGAHYDHLGLGGHSSLAAGSTEPHNGADDNASGTAALIEVARRLEATQNTLARDVYFVAFSAEERGLVGSTYFVSALPPGITSKNIVAMLNMDMVGRLRKNKLSVLGGNSAKEWSEIVDPVCETHGVVCNLSGGGYGPSDQTPFYASGVPVLHFFTGAHSQYHRPTDDTHLINAIGSAQVAAIVADVAGNVAGRGQLLTYNNAPSPARRGDQRSHGASLGSVPDYTAPGPGVLLTGVRPESPAAKAGLRRGDRIMRIGTHDLASVRDLMFVLRQSKPGQTTDIEVERDGKRVKSKVTFGKSRRRR